MSELKLTVCVFQIQISQNTNRIKQVLESKKIPFEEIDLYIKPESRIDMMEKSGNPEILPPQLFNGDTYCGCFEQFDDALEDGVLLEFLRLK
ncbi:SH3 domain-binding glutamic acid-rich-like protein 3 [Mizuhopecten yessoensis]|uniref:SH3 domain-binding glutamic acid-rich-like protein 3 n=1 Tax=Mizuhopecten yessoensis TaxID=6573 RepID=A0A210PX78_MIZYE|nr:SH3 domain-binding glutamic acid-rich-like protein 3 [Mizuhopecten yessoensis]